MKAATDLSNLFRVAPRILDVPCDIQIFSSTPCIFSISKIIIAAAAFVIVVMFTFIG